MAQLLDIGVFSVVDTDSSLGVGWKVNVYLEGTSTRLATYPTLADAAASTNANANPVVIGADGRLPPMWYKASAKVILTDENDVVKETLNPVQGFGSASLDFLQSGTGAVSRTMEAKLRDVVSVKDFGALGNDSTDDTAAFQAAVTAQLAGQIGGVYLPRGIYRISSAISFPNNTMTGLHIYGESRGDNGSIIKQMTDDTAIFSFGEVDILHTSEFRGFKMTWANAQTGNDNATCFRFVKKAAGANQDVYNNHFHDLAVTNCYTFMRGDVDFWGNSIRDITIGTNGGTVDLDGTGGQPKNTWDNVYTSGGAASEIHYRVNAMVNDFYVEVNGGSALMLKDWGGGRQFIRHWAIESTSYAASGALFDCLNSTLICPGVIYTAALTLTSTAALDMFRTSGAKGHIKVETVDWNFTSQAVGTVFTLLGNAGDMPSEFGQINGTLTAPNATPVAQLTAVPSNAICEKVAVRSWIDPTRVLVAGDANITLDYDDPFNIHFGTVALTADRTVTFLRHNGVSGNSYFRAVRHKVTKFTGAGTTYKIDMLDYAGNVIATIPAATASGSKAIRWDRASPIGTAGLGFLTAEPLPV